jgi:hypothetical protein
VIHPDSARARVLRVSAGRILAVLRVVDPAIHASVFTIKGVTDIDLMMAGRWGGGYQGNQDGDEWRLPCLISFLWLGRRGRVDSLPLRG